MYHENTAIILQEALDILTHLKHKKMTLETFKEKMNKSLKEVQEKTIKPGEENE